MDPAVSTCDECKETHSIDKELAPCDTCERPLSITPGNEKPLVIWQECDALRELSVGMGGVMPQKLKASEIKTQCDVFGGTVEDYQGVLDIEKIMFSVVAERYKKK